MTASGVLRWRVLHCGLVAVAFAFFVGGASAAATEVYSNEALAGDKVRYQEKFAFLLDKGLRDFMTPEERRTVRDVAIWHPPRGAGLLSFTSLMLDGRPTIRAPLMSIKFVEDLSVAYAWRYQNRHSLEPMDEYLVALKHRPAADFPGGRALDPMVALGVPPRIWERDPRVDDLSLRFRNTAWAFILAHELGHVRLGHLSGEATPAEIQRQEEAADNFAVELLGRSDTIPMGMILWFQATAGYLPNRSDFASDADYGEWLRAKAEHPVNGSRMRNLAAALRRQAAAARDANSADVLNYIAERLAIIGETVEDPEMQQFLKRCAMSRRIEDLKRLDDRPCS